jgi:hypothetical protein
MTDQNDVIRSFLATEPGSLGLKEKLAQLEAETVDEQTAPIENKPEPKTVKGTPSTIVITRSESLDPAEYRRLREIADKQGKTLQIVDDGPPSANDGPPQASPVRYVGDEEAGTLYINAAIRDRVGVLRVQEIAREKGFKEARTFRSTRDLPDHLQRQHQQTLLDRKPGTLLDGGA